MTFIATMLPCQRSFSAHLVYSTAAPCHSLPCCVRQVAPLDQDLPLSRSICLFPLTAPEMAVEVTRGVQVRARGCRFRRGHWLGLGCHVLATMPSPSPIVSYH